MKNEIPDLDKAGLRQFALMSAGLVGLIFGLFFPWVLDASWPRWPWYIAIVLTAWGLIAPSTLNPLYQVWMRFGLVMGAIMSRVVLTIVFFVLLMPMGIVMRVVRDDPLQLKLKENEESYRNTRPEYDPKSMERPF